MTEYAKKEEAAKRLGVRFAVCAQCCLKFPWDEDETFSVMTPSGEDYEDGLSDIRFYCSHACASLKIANLPGGAGIIWRGGKCGGTSMPVMGEP